MYDANQLYGLVSHEVLQPYNVGNRPIRVQTSPEKVLWMVWGGVKPLVMRVQGSLDLTPKARTTLSKAPEPLRPLQGHDELWSLGGWESFGGCVWVSTLH